MVHRQYVGGGCGSAFADTVGRCSDEQRATGELRRSDAVVKLTHAEANQEAGQPDSQGVALVAVSRRKLKSLFGEEFSARN